MANHKRSFMLVKKQSQEFGVAWIPAFPSDKEKTGRAKFERPYLFTIADDRNPQHHRKLFAIFKTVIDNDPSETFFDTDMVLTWVKFKAGYVTPVMVNDETVFHTKSINFSTMGQEKFNIFYSKALSLCSQYLGITEDELEQNIHSSM